MFNILCFGRSDCIVPMRRKPRLESIKTLYHVNWQPPLVWCLTALGTAGVEPTSTIKGTGVNDQKSIPGRSRKALTTIYAIPAEEPNKP